MAKFYGPIGFEIQTEERPGVWKPMMTERLYAGDLLRNRRRTQNSDQVNDNLELANEISIVSDPFAMSNLGSFRYVRYLGANWKITSVDVQFPRLILTIGGVYNGFTGPQSSPAGEDTAP